MRAVIVCLVGVQILSTDTIFAADPARVENSFAVESFRLPDIENQAVTVAASDDVRATVVCFLGTECPLAKLYASRLNRLSTMFHQQGVRFVGVNSNRQDSMDDLRSYSQKHQLTFPLLKDHQNVVADRFAAERTPEVFLLDQSFVVRYRGRIDDQYAPGFSKAKPTRSDLKIAIERLLDGDVMTSSRTEAPGCIIGRVRQPVQSSDVTYTQQVARIFQRHCIECHREDEIGPFSLTEYDEAVGWADTILEVIEDGRMPPWHANPEFGDFSNERRMSEADKETLKKWLAAGLPYGDPEDLPAAVEFTEGWRLSREPDVVLEMGTQAFEVPAEGTVDYQYFVVDPGFDEDQWVTAAEVQPGNRSVVHHSIVFVRPPDGSRFRGLGWVAAYVPGQQVTGFPQGAGLRVPAGSKFVFQQHYTPTGTAQRDKTRIGLLLGDESQITHEVYTIVALDQEFEIPPGASQHKVSARIERLPRDATLLSISPHMHLRGKAFRLFRRDGDSRQILLDVPKYDFNWQHSYRLREPLPLATLSGLEFEALFDNSENNPVNPDPSQHVMWGDQTYEEMALAFCEVSEPRVKPTQVKETTNESVPADSTVLSAEVRARMSGEADRMFSRFDTNNDGTIDRFETPWVFRRYSFGSIDANRDGKLTRDEIEDAASYRVR